MECDYKDFAWDSNQDDHHLNQQEEENDLAALVDSSSTRGREGDQSSSSSFNLVDLKLGSSTSAEVVAPIATKVSDLVLSASRTTKKVDEKLKVSSLAATTCLVDGCKADLSRCREYHRRHRVCELHSKTPIVVIRGQQKRFCQQCSRFHSLVEFDEVKRSCRKRLNGHNQRRRKPNPESFYFTSKSFISNCKGPITLHFGNPQLCATTSVRNLWPTEAKSTADHQSRLYNRHPQFQAVDHLLIPPNSFTNNGGADKPLIFLQSNNEPKLAAFNQAAIPEAFTREPFPTLTAAAVLPRISTRATAAGSPISFDGTTHGIDPSCALYLLSSSNPTHSLGNASVSQMVHPNMVTSTNSDHQPLQMKSFTEFPLCCSINNGEDNYCLS